MHVLGQLSDQALAEQLDLRGGDSHEIDGLVVE